MPDLPAIPELTPKQLDFVIEQLALNPHKLIEVKDSFERFYGKTIHGEVVQRVNSECQKQIEDKRLEIYTNQVNSLPIAHSFTILSLAQSRIEHLLKNPKIIRQERKIDPSDGREYFENETYVDDNAMQKWATIAQQERFLTLKLEIERIVKFADSKEKLPIRKTGFQPITINTGFSLDDEKEQAQS